MKIIQTFLSCIIFITIVLCSSASAKQLRCEYSLDNLQVEAALRPGFERSYTVDVSCNILCTHHGDSDRDSTIIYRNTISPVVVEEVGEKGKAEATRQGETDAARRAWLRLLEDCGVQKCDCKNKGCACDACGKPAPLATSLEYRIETAPIPKQDASADKPIVLKGIESTNNIKGAMKDYISKHFGDSNIAGYIRTMFDDRFIEIVHITDKSHQPKLIYFDLTDIYKKLEKSGDKGSRDKVEQLSKKYLPLPKESRPL